MLRFKVRVVPNAKKNAIVGEYGDAVKIKIRAPANDGKANAELLKFLSEIFEIPRSGIKIISGETARDKLLEASVPESDIAKLTITPQD